MCWCVVCGAACHHDMRVVVRRGVLCIFACYVLLTYYAFQCERCVVGWYVVCGMLCTILGMFVVCDGVWCMPLCVCEVW